ncbi:MAG: heme-binding domain-containing protein [Ignavibacteriae bacterium]|nr:heme-binding domain-containing protein [Ignavibacteriota bacterium]
MRKFFHLIAAQKKKILYVLLAAAVLVQFFRPIRNLGSSSSPQDITHTTSVPSDVQAILTKSCYDCHSDHTEYPWYANIQPIGWWMTDHINEGKQELNFSQFNTYSISRKMRKFHHIEEEVEEGEMPLDSYLWIHGNAELSPTQKKLVIEWAIENRMVLEKQYPDSIPKKRK